MSWLIGSMLADSETRRQTIEQVAQTLTENHVAEIAILMDDGTVHEFKSPLEIAIATVGYLAAKAAEQQ
jgi:hypothetical protein